MNGNGSLLKRKRRIAVVTGTRAEYGLLTSVMTAIRDHPRLTLQTVVTGMHLLKKFGSTVRCIERDGWTIDATVPMQRGDDTATDQAIGLSRGVKGIAEFIDRGKTDVVLVLGDRIEAMAGALAAVTTGRFLAHVHGGDVAPGDLDESLRHSITKLAHIHLAASKDAARRIKRMGERSETIHVVGAPGMDDLVTVSRKTRDEAEASTALVVQHAFGRSVAIERRVMSDILQAVRSLRLEPLVVYPNSDRGHSGVLAAITSRKNASAKGRPIRTVRSLGRGAYLEALASARVLIGNSSSGIIEAPAIGVPSVNIGPRQQGRLRGGSSVIDADETYASIRDALQRALSLRPKKTRTSVYGDGQAGRRIAEVLASAPLTCDLRTKCNTF